MKRYVLTAALVIVSLLGSAANSSEAAFVDDSFTLNSGDSRFRAAYAMPYEEFQLTMQSDGNLVLYSNDYHYPGVTRSVIWTTWTYGNPGARAVMQTDGNFVVYSTTNQVLFSTWTYGHSGALFNFSSDGSLTIYDTDSSVLWTSGTSQLSSNPGAQAPFSSRFADSSYHNHMTVEPDAAERSDWQARFDGQGAELVYEPTDLSIVKYTGAYNATIDVYWEQTPSTAGIAETWCRYPISGTDKCDQWRVRFSDEVAGYPSHMKNNAVCHEFGHTVGFRDGGLNGGSCMTGGDSSRLKSYERSSINGRY